MASNIDQYPEAIHYSAAATGTAALEVPLSAKKLIPAEDFSSRSIVMAVLVAAIAAGHALN
jgi:hypothetical protein